MIKWLKKIWNWFLGKVEAGEIKIINNNKSMITWRPDTCACVITYEVIDKVISNYQFQVQCNAHLSFTAEEVLQENQRKNRAMKVVFDNFFEDKHKIKVSDIDKRFNDYEKSRTLPVGKTAEDILNEKDLLLSEFKDFVDKEVFKYSFDAQRNIVVETPEKLKKIKSKLGVDMASDILVGDKADKILFNG